MTTLRSQGLPATGRCLSHGSWSRSALTRARRSTRHTDATGLALLMCLLSPGAALAATFNCNWTTGASGTWTTAGDWSSCNSTDPNNGGGNIYNATISVGGSYTVTLATPVTLGTLTLDNGGATLANSSTLTTGDGVTLTAGTLQGGTYDTGGTTAVSVQSGTLSGVTLNGSLDLTSASSNAFIQNGLTVNQANGSAGGTINLTGSNATLYLAPTTTSLNNVTINMGAATGGYTYLTAGYGGTETLTLGSNASVVSSGLSGYYDLLNQSSASTIVNDGALSVSTTGTVSGNGHGLYISPATFTNNGSITANGTSFVTVATTTFTNSSTGTITGGNGSTVTLENAFTNAGTITMNGTTGTTTLQLGNANTTSASSTTNWSNSGTITAANTNVLLGGSFTTADVNTLNLSGTSTVALNGYLTNTASTLNIATGSLAGLTMQNGTIFGGTITGGSSNLYTANNSSGTLDGVTLNGPLSLTGTSASALIADGLTVNAANGTSPGVINITANGASLDIEPTTTSLNNVTINMGAATGGYTYLTAGYGGAETLTLGSNVNVVSSGLSGYYDLLNQSSTSTIVNDGALSVSTTGTVSGNGHGLYIDPATFTNNGSITANGTSFVTVATTTFTNSSTGTITGGNGSTVTLENAFTNAGTITMNGTTGTTTLQLGNANTTSASSTTNWSNSGTITAANTNVLLGGSFTTADVNTLNLSGTSTVALNGYLTNTASTLNIATGSLAGLTMQNGTIFGGTITGGSSNLYTANNSSGTLDGVTLNGPLSLTGTSASALIADGLTVNAANGTSPGVINITANGASLDIEPTTTSLNNVTINMGAATG